MDDFNNRLDTWADYSDEDAHLDQHGHGKRVPYIGWYWRKTDFTSKRISIGHCGLFIGVMENNKWGYPDRLLSKQEADTFILHLTEAFALVDAGKREESEQKFNELWDWFQTLEIEAWV